MRENNRFRFTGGAEIPPMEPVQGTANMSPLEMKVESAKATLAKLLAENRGQPDKVREADELYARMQYGQAAYEPDPEELDARELTARKGLTGMDEDSYKKALIELLFGGWDHSGLQK